MLLKQKYFGPNVIYFVLGIAEGPATCRIVEMRQVAGEPDVAS